MFLFSCETANERMNKQKPARCKKKSDCFVNVDYFINMAGFGLEGGNRSPGKQFTISQI